FPDGHFFPDSTFFPDGHFFPDSTFFPDGHFSADPSMFPDTIFVSGETLVTNPDNMDLPLSDAEKRLLRDGFAVVPGGGVAY
ncbi:MAG: hypothetical protein ABEJ70_04810, partial [Halobacteriaceae archaeon]